MEEKEKRVIDFFQGIQKLRLWEPHIKGVDLTIAQIGLLVFIARNPNCRMQDIADGMRITPPSVSVAIRKLEENDWVQKNPDPNDGRASCISLTDKSGKILVQARGAQLAAMDKFLIGLSDDEQELLLTLLEKSLATAEAADEAAKGIN